MYIVAGVEDKFRAFLTSVLHGHNVPAALSRGRSPRCSLDRGGRVGPRVSQDVVDEEKYSVPSENRIPVIQSGIITLDYWFIFVLQCRRGYVFRGLRYVI